VNDSRRLDSEEAERRLRQTQQALAGGTNALADALDRVYRQRAEVLARPTSAAGLSGNEDILLFHLGEGRFAVPLADVAEVIVKPKLTPIPGAPDTIAGLIQVRGEVRPIWIVSSVLGIHADQGSGLKNGEVILLRDGTRESGILVSQVEDILAISPQDRRPGNLPGSWMTADFITVVNVKIMLENVRNSAQL
jgi:chemotaxis signal transduction protein